ncbi:hypothetical protein E2C01_057559 [Portunus trituberculatus]|uniref:Uncharacterized protein n=1 Tax=Portunus trituberculatus TaxID=210409 RepID=A0A5B7GTU6_PORTR|nr:hypothetical protein [Portunus trituberculatus]
MRKSSFDEIAATLQELFPSIQGVVGGTYPKAVPFLLTLPVRQKKSKHRFGIVTGGRHHLLGGLLGPCRLCVTASSAPKVPYAAVMCSGYMRWS